MRFSVAKLTHAIELVFDAPLTQHALSPANALDAVSIAAAIRTVVVILVMVKCSDRASAVAFNFHHREIEVARIDSRVKTKATCR